MKSFDRSDLINLGALTLFLVLLVYLLHLPGQPDHVSVNRVSDSQVSIECNDEREPVVTKFENSTHITVTCKEVQ